MHELLQLRLLVATLGEVSSPPWWGTQLLGPTGRAMLGRLVPRAGEVSALWTVSAAAARVHDARVGVGDVAHLFRLPSGLEERLYEAAWATLQVDPPSPGSLSMPEAKEQLTRLARGVTAPEVRGPVQIGNFGTLTMPRGVARLAAYYLSGFERGQPVFPYVVS